MISGILRPDEGSVKVENVDIGKLDTDAIADFRLNSIGFVFQDYHLFPCLTTAENVAIPLILKRVAWNEAIEKAEHFLDIVGLKDRAKLPPVKASMPTASSRATSRAGRTSAFIRK